MVGWVVHWDMACYDAPLTLPPCLYVMLGIVGSNDHWLGSPAVYSFFLVQQPMSLLLSP